MTLRETYGTANASGSGSEVEPGERGQLNSFDRRRLWWSICRGQKRAHLFWFRMASAVYLFLALAIGILKYFVILRNASPAATAPQLPVSVVPFPLGEKPQENLSKSPKNVCIPSLPRTTTTKSPMLSHSKFFTCLLPIMSSRPGPHTDSPRIETSGFLYH